MRSLIIIIGFLLGGYTSTLYAQQPVQTLRGTLTDAVSGQPLVGATVQLSGVEEGKVTDGQGVFRWEKIPVGRYQLEARFLGYQNLLLQEILVESGKEVVLNLRIEPAPTQFSTVEVTAVTAGYDLPHPLSVKSISVDQVQRFPATYYDPARVAASYAGVVNANDQSNALSIRGHSPDHLSWQLEELPILNPNHTPNAGNVSDRIRLNSGGINMLSAQMLSDTRLYTGAFPASYGNALSGIMDMRFRRGNRQQHEYTAQAGLIGLDIAAEGPIGKNERSSFLVNYRYSTVGLLTQLGVDFGEEAINFQDLSFNFSFSGKKGQELTLFGVGGVSTNTFEGKRDPSEWETDRDLFDVDFEARSGSAGISWRQPVGDQGMLYAVAGASIVDQQREQRLVVDSFTFMIPIRLAFDANTLSLYSFHSYYQQQMSKSRIRFRVGARASFYDFSIDNSRLPFTIDGFEYSVVQPYLSLRTIVNSRLSLQLGLNLAHYDQTASTYLEPRASLAYQLTNTQQLSLAYGSHSQLLSPYQPFRPDEIAPQRAHHYNLRYEWQIKPELTFSTEVFYHQLYDIPLGFRIDGLFYSLFSTYNLGGISGVVTTSEKTEGINQGIEFELNQYLKNGMYYLLNTTIYQSTYEIAGRTESTPFDGGYVANATVGKEWTKKKAEDKVRTLGLNLRMVSAGGFREPGINLDNSDVFNQTIYWSYSFFDNQLPNIFRTDFRIYLKRSRTNYSTTLALDLQNVTNQENVAFNYYDILNRRVEQRNQISLVPILTYRVEF